MLTKTILKMFSTAPHVWVNKHTKVICQGMTGNQVYLIFYLGNFSNSTSFVI